MECVGASFKSPWILDFDIPKSTFFDNDDMNGLDCECLRTRGLYRVRIKTTGFYMMSIHKIAKFKTPSTPDCRLKTRQQKALGTQRPALQHPFFPGVSRGSSAFDKNKVDLRGHDVFSIGAKTGRVFETLPQTVTGMYRLLKP